MTKRQKLKHLENEKSFRGGIRSIFIIFKGLSVAEIVSDLRAHLFDNFAEKRSYIYDVHKND